MSHNQQHIEALGYIEQEIDGAVEDIDTDAAYFWIPADELAESLADGLELTEDAAHRLLKEMVRDGLLVSEEDEDNLDYGLTKAGADALGYGHEYIVR